MDKSWMEKFSFIFGIVKGFCIIITLGIVLYHTASFAHALGTIQTTLKGLEDIPKRVNAIDADLMVLESKDCK